MSRDLKLPSGKTLHIQPAKFKVAKALYQAFAEELKGLKVDAETDISFGLMKDLICTALSSEKIESRLWDCFSTVTIDNILISEDLFEPIEARDDWFTVCMEVARDNVLPFTKSLMPWFLVLLGKAKNSLESK